MDARHEAGGGNTREVAKRYVRRTGEGWRRPSVREAMQGRPGTDWQWHLAGCWLPAPRVGTGRLWTRTRAWDADLDMEVTLASPAAAQAGVQGPRTEYAVPNDIQTTPDAQAVPLYLGTWQLRSTQCGGALCTWAQLPRLAVQLNQVGSLAGLLEKGPRGCLIKRPMV